ncbi:MAG TPA: hypothetical protein VMW89_03755 [Desulfatiglandales bacterium]|nr:hypothetical protein [Desulfatiglandales bacterium]
MMRDTKALVHEFDNKFIHSGLSAALGHELEAEWLGPNGVSILSGSIRQNT